MCENAYLSIKNPKASRALKWALDPSHRLLTLLARLCFAASATFSLRSWGPPDQILDPHLPTYDITKISQKLHEIEKKLGRRGAHTGGANINVFGNIC